jgi:hypothetical protein
MELVEMVGWLMAGFVPSLLIMESSYRMGISKTLKRMGHLKEVNFLLNNIPFSIFYKVIAVSKDPP